MFDTQTTPFSISSLNVLIYTKSNQKFLNNFLRFVVPLVLTTEITTFWEVIVFRLVDVCKRFRKICYPDCGYR
jgi:hypothetical protein